MGAPELKSRIQAFLENADDRVLNIVNSVFESYYQDDQVAFKADGTPMTRKEYKVALDTAERQIANGDFIDVDEFEKEEN